MNITTTRLLIRDLHPQDALTFAEMAADGRLHDVGFDEHCNGLTAGLLSP